MPSLFVFIAVYAVVLFPIVVPPVLMGGERIVRAFRRAERVAIVAPQRGLVPQAA